jgi:hypothetical protein
MEPLYLLTQAELARQINISERSLERWRVEGAGPEFVKAGRKVLYRPQDIERWLRQCTRRSTSESGSRDV